MKKSRKKLLETKVKLSQTSLLFFLLLFFSSCEGESSAGSAPFRVVGYVPEYRTGLNWKEVVKKVTDLILFSIEATSEGDLHHLDRLPSSEELERIRSLINHQPPQEAGLEDETYPNTTPRTNLVVCVGGGGRSSGLAQALKSEGSRSKLVTSLVQLLYTKNLNGVDIDWEQPSSEMDYANFYSFLKGLREALLGHHSISVAIHPGQEAMLSRHNIWELVDFVSVMAYDNLCYYPRTQPPCMHSTLEFSKLVVSHAQSQVPKDQWHKLVLGIPFYGRHTHTGDAKTYYELVELGEKLEETSSREGGGGGGGLDHHGDMIQSHSFNGHETIRQKVDLALKNNLGGVMLWELGQDLDPKEENSLLYNLHQYVIKEANAENTKKGGPSMAKRKRQKAREQKLKNLEEKGEL